MKSSSAAPLRLPGMTSRFVKGRSSGELPISRQSSTHATAAFRSSGWDSVLASIWIGSSGLGPVKRIWPRLFGRTTPPYNVQEAAGGLNLRLSRRCTAELPPGRSVNPECQDQDCSSRRTLPRLHCCGEQAVPDTPTYTRQQNDPESSVLHLEGVAQPVCADVVAQPHRQCQKASAPSACASRPTKEQPRVQP